MKKLNNGKMLLKASASSIILMGLLLQANIAAADTSISCQASGGTNCQSADDSISDALADLVSEITVPQGSCAAGSITEVQVSLNINHTWVGDLGATLLSPGGASTNVLLDRPGRPPAGPGFGCASDNVSAIFDDGGALDAEDVCNAPPPAVSGIVRPFPFLNVFDGGNADGTWTLTISDNAGGDTGELVDWGLNIQCSPVATDVPVFSIWGLVSLMGLLGLGGSFASRRRKLK